LGVPAAPRCVEALRSGYWMILDRRPLNLATAEKTSKEAQPQSGLFKGTEQAALALGTSRKL